MSEKKEYKMKHAAAPVVEEVQENEKENVPRAEEAVQEEMQDTAAKAKKKKRKKARMPVRLAAVLLVIAMLFGVIVGYAIGRSTGEARLIAAQQRIDELTLAAEEAGREEIDVFTDQISAENRAALADLSGMSMQTGGENNVFLGEDGFTGISASAETNPVVVAEYTGGQLMSDEVSREYNDRLTSYLFSGYTEEEIAASLLDDVLRSMVSQRVLEAQAQKMGLYELTSADAQQIAAQAQARYEEQLAFYTSFVYAEGMSDEEAAAAAQAFLKETEGVDYESIRAGIEADWWQQKLRSAVVKDVQVGPSEIMDAYNARLDDQKESFSADPAAFEEAQMQGKPILYNLAGYRAVKPLMIRMDDTAAAQAQAEELLVRIRAGESFDSLLGQYGADEGMKNASLRAAGYYVSASTTRWPAAFVEAAMALQAPGEVSGVIALEDGACILQYVGEVKAGEVDMAKVYDAITAEALAAAQDIAYDAQLTKWLDEADPKYYPERMQ